MVAGIGSVPFFPGDGSSLFYPVPETGKIFLIHGVIGDVVEPVQRQCLEKELCTEYPGIEMVVVLDRNLVFQGRHDIVVTVVRDT